MWKDIGRNILKGTIVTVGTKVMAEKIVPAATEFGKEAWDKIKNTKSTGKKEPSHKATKTEVVDSEGRRKVYDAEFSDEGQQG